MHKAVLRGLVLILIFLKIYISLLAVRLGYVDEAIWTNQEKCNKLIQTKDTCLQLRSYLNQLTTIPYIWWGMMDSRQQVEGEGGMTDYRHWCIRGRGQGGFPTPGV